MKELLKKCPTCGDMTGLCSQKHDVNQTNEEYCTCKTPILETINLDENSRHVTCGKLLKPFSENEKARIGIRTNEEWEKELSDPACMFDEDDHVISVEDAKNLLALQKQKIIAVLEESRKDNSIEHRGTNTQDHCESCIKNNGYNQALSDILSAIKDIEV